MYIYILIFTYIYIYIGLSRRVYMSCRLCISCFAGTFVWCRRTLSASECASSTTALTLRSSTFTSTRSLPARETRIWRETRIRRETRIWRETRVLREMRIRKETKTRRGRGLRACRIRIWSWWVRFMFLCIYVCIWYIYT